MLNREKVFEKAHAKLNLCLDITGRRDDGYHLVRMVMQTVDLCDEICVSRAEEPGVKLFCVCEGIPGDTLPEEAEKNLAWRAAKLLLDELLPEGTGIRVDMKKRVPSGAGLGGGSADAAAVLRAVNRLFGLGKTEKELEGYGLSLGADVPFCVSGGIALAEGIGERLTPLERGMTGAVLIAKPSMPLSTGAVYSAFDALACPPRADTDRMAEALKTGQKREAVMSLANVLEAASIPMCPVISRVKKEMIAAGAHGALMSGSGSAVFGVYESRKEAEAAKEKLAASFAAEDDMLFFVTGFTE